MVQEASLTSHLPRVDIAPLPTDALWPPLHRVEQTWLDSAAHASSATSGGQGSSDVTRLPSAPPALLPSGLQQAQEAFYRAFGIRSHDAANKRRHVASQVVAPVKDKAPDDVHHPDSAPTDDRVALSCHDDEANAMPPGTGRASEAPSLAVSGQAACVRCFHGTVLQRTLLQALLILHLPHRSPAVQFTLHGYHNTLVVIPSLPAAAASSSLPCVMPLASPLGADTEVPVAGSGPAQPRRGRSLSFAVRPTCVPPSVCSADGVWWFTLYELAAHTAAASEESEEDVARSSQSDKPCDAPALVGNADGACVSRVGCRWRCLCQPSPAPSHVPHAMLRFDTFLTVDDAALRACLVDEGATAQASQTRSAPSELTSHPAATWTGSLPHAWMHMVQRATHTTSTVSELVTHMMQARLFVWPIAGEPSSRPGGKREREGEGRCIGPIRTPMRKCTTTAVLPTRLAFNVTRSLPFCRPVPLTPTRSVRTWPGMGMFVRFFCMR